MTFDDATDLLVVGSGGGALTSALTAAAFGARSLVIEKTNLYGGTSATSGGNIWIPNSHHTNASPHPDSRQNALTYLSAAIGVDVAPQVLEKFVDEAPEMLRFVEQNSPLRFDARSYSDYYSELPGAKPEGYRTHEPRPLHARRLGDDFQTLRPLHHSLVVLGRYSYTNAEGIALLTQAPGWQFTILKMMARYWCDLGGRLKGRRTRFLTGGNALIAGLRCALKERSVPVWLNAPLAELITEDGRVRGAVIHTKRGGIRVEARKGVVLGAGGFEHNSAMRDRYLPQPNSSNWSASQTGNTGDALRAGQALWADTALLDCAWWIPVICAPGVERPWTLFAERGSPGHIMVNRQGLRFTNEAAPYLECGEAMYQAPGGAAVPSFIVFDARFRQTYPLGCLGPGSVFPDSKLPASWLGTVYFKADSIERLAADAGIDPKGLSDSVRRINAYAKTGVDLDFHRGNSAYDRYYGDKRVKPNPCLAPLTQPPYYAVVTYPGDIGTKGGLRTNEHAQVLRRDDSTIEGLYAIGNSAACVMGRRYPGAGATIGPCMAFGYVAARHALGRT